jgi:hypothetical protein
MRQVELLALRWNDVDLEAAVCASAAASPVASSARRRTASDATSDLISRVVELLTGVCRTRSDAVRAWSSTPETTFGLFFPTIVLRRHLYPAMAAAGIAGRGPTQEIERVSGHDSTAVSREARDRVSSSPPARPVGIEKTASLARRAPRGVNVTPAPRFQVGLDSSRIRSSPSKRSVGCGFDRAAAVRASCWRAARVVPASSGMEVRLLVGRA